MARPRLSRLQLVILLTLLVSAGAGAARPDSSSTDDGDHLQSHQPRHARIFSFGDSLTDTGNALRILGDRATISRPPYGETFFGRPSGRASDGRIMIEFVAEALGVPQPTPYLLAFKTAAADFRRGVNFAVGGGTALEPAFFEGRGLKAFVPVSLRIQTTWFKNVVHRLGSEQRNVTASSLFVVGEIGANDYLIGLFANRTVGELKTVFLPRIIRAMHSALMAVIAAGARTVVVPGLIPLGCEPKLLTLYQGRVGGGAGGYDPASGCMTSLNDLAELHNRKLRRMLRAVRRRVADSATTSIVYADLYGAVTDIIVSPGRYGFMDRPLVACCGGGGAYNVDMAADCGAPGTKACADPWAYVSWDGVHFTEAANRRIACSVLGTLPLTTHTQAGRCSRIGCDCH